MKKTRFREIQIVKAIQEHESGRDAKNILPRVADYNCSFYKSH